MLVTFHTLLMIQLTLLETIVCDLQAHMQVAAVTLGPPIGLETLKRSWRRVIEHRIFRLDFEV